MINDHSDEKIITLEGRIDSNNAFDVEKRLMEQASPVENEGIILDAEKLEYISSAGLRILLRLKKECGNIRVINVNSDVYEIFDTTGFTEMFDVEKSYRRVSIDDCVEIGRGANGIIYRMDTDNVVKVYEDINALDEIRHERKMAKLALILGIPTAISYDVVKIGDKYGSVFELLSSVSFSNILSTEPDRIGWCVDESVKLLKLIHGISVPKGKLPDIRERVLSWVDYLNVVLPEDKLQKIRRLINDIPYEDSLIHGDFHTKNLMVHNGEVMIIDMETLAVGHPVFDLAFMFNAYQGFSEYDNEQVKRFQGFDIKTSVDFWNRSLAKYLETDDAEKIRKIRDKARVIGYIRLIEFGVVHLGIDTDVGRNNIAVWKEHLLELLDETETLVF